MNPFIYGDISAHRAQEFRCEAHMNRIAKNTTPTTDRPARSLRGALGNGLIALGERLTETPVDESKDYDRAA